MKKQTECFSLEEWRKEKRELKQAARERHRDERVIHDTINGWLDRCDTCGAVLLTGTMYDCDMECQAISELGAWVKNCAIERYEVVVDWEDNYFYLKKKGG